METLTGIPQQLETVPNPPDIFNTQLSRRGFFKLLGSRAAAGVTGYMVQRLGLLPLLSAESPPKTEKVFENIEVIAMSGNASGDRLACVFRDPLDSTIHAAWMRPDLANKRWVGEEIKLHPDIKILHGGRPISGGIEMSEDGKITAVFGYTGNPEVYSNDGAFSFDGETLYTHPDMGEIFNLEISTDNRFLFIAARPKNDPSGVENCQYDLDTKEFRRLPGDITPFRTRVRPMANNAYRSYFPNFSGYIESTVYDGRVTNQTLRPEQAPLDRGITEFPDSRGESTILTINNVTRTPGGLRVGTIYANKGLISRSFQPKDEEVIRALGKIPEGYSRGSIDLTVPAEFKGAGNFAIVGITKSVFRANEQGNLLPLVVRFSHDNPNDYFYYPVPGLPILISNLSEVMRNVFTLSINNTTVPVVTIEKIPYFYDQDARMWQRGSLSVGKLPSP